MPAVSASQQEMMGADLSRARKGLPTRTHMTIAQLKEFASTKRKGLPYKVSAAKSSRRHRVAKLRAGMGRGGEKSNAIRT